jgi:hypothetical protein
MAAISFDEVFAAEIDAINTRRLMHLLARPVAGWEIEGHDPDGKPIVSPTAASELIGLSLSGGGVRSAAFCLGALQALDESGVLARVDYISSVSGGGYIGTSTVAGMSVSKDCQFPFPSKLQPEEQPSLRHVRDHSNYLFPHGRADVLGNLAIYLRGLMANTLCILPWLFGLAGLMVLVHPTLMSLFDTPLRLLHGPLAGLLSWPALSGFKTFLSNLFQLPLVQGASSISFPVTALVALFILTTLLCWSIQRSWFPNRSDVGTRGMRITAVALGVFAAAVLYDLQPIILVRMFGLAKDNFIDRLMTPFLFDWGGVLAPVLAPLTAVLGFASSFLAKLLKTGSESPKWQARIFRYSIKALMYAAAAAAPLILWISFLYLVYWGIADNGVDLWPAACEPFCHTPLLFRGPIQAMNDCAAGLYICLAFGFLIVQMALMPNANSLHRLYRDRLSKAFLFDPTTAGETDRARTAVKHGAVPSRSRKWLDSIKLSEIECCHAPYQIINAALNIRGSKYANQRGRNADFFIFTPQFVGSRATGYARTTDVEQLDSGLDLAAAMAISGAAASANMGASTIKALTSTLALLNIRLGYWLPNPRVAANRDERTSLLAQIFDQHYFLLEMLGWLHEGRNLVYLTDGGHIENLGIYELLRRRCELIIAVDAEADPGLTFGSFVELQRHALIDLGVRVSLPWSTIRDCANKASKQVAETGGVAWVDAEHGPHVALGKIEYPNDRTGILLYIKSSLSGDENDYVVDYKRRYPEFPHEATADQLFSEEQFEVYRALGFHAARRAISGEDKVAMENGPAKWDEGGDKSLVPRLLELLGRDQEKPPVRPRRSRRRSTKAPAQTP